MPRMVPKLPRNVTEFSERRKILGMVAAGLCVIMFFLFGSESENMSPVLRETRAQSIRTAKHVRMIEKRLRVMEHKLGIASGGGSAYHGGGSSATSAEWHSWFKDPTVSTVPVSAGLRNEYNLAQRLYSLSPKRGCPNPYLNTLSDSEAERLVSDTEEARDLVDIARREEEVNGWAWDVLPLVHSPKLPIHRIYHDPQYDGDKPVTQEAAVLQQDGCIIYSVGSKNEWEFEEWALEYTKCQIFTFDCSVEGTPNIPDQDRITFYPWCWTANGAGQRKSNYKSYREVTQTLQHDHVDLLKMDIEGFEYDVVDSILQDLVEFRGKPYPRPMQLIVEIHRGSDHLNLNLADVSQLWMDGGYTPLGKIQNPICSDCIEVNYVLVEC